MKGANRPRRETRGGHLRSDRGKTQWGPREGAWKDDMGEAGEQKVGGRDAGGAQYSPRR